MKEANLLRLELNNGCVMSLSSSELREPLGHDSIRNCRLKWCGHVERCSDDSLVKDGEI